MRFNHMELTFPVGSLTATLREEIDAFYGETPLTKREGDATGADAKFECAALRRQLREERHRGVDDVR